MSATRHSPALLDFPIDMAQPILDFNARFGRVQIERYRVSDTLRLSVEFDREGKVAAIQIAPEHFGGFNPHLDPRVPSEVADHILNQLLPEATSAGDASETIIPSTYPGFCRETRHLPGVLVTRDYPLGTDRSRMIAATMATTTASIDGQFAPAVSGFGLAEYQRFPAGDDLAVGVNYRADGAIEGVSVSEMRPLLDRGHEAKPIQEAAANAISAEIVPASFMAGDPCRHKFVSGAFSREHKFFDEVVVVRDFVFDAVVSITVFWRSRSA